MAAPEANIQRCARVIGDGEFALAVVGATEHQADLEILAGGRSEEGALKLCAALLQPKPGNPAGREVAVIVHSCTVGYLAPKAVPALLAALEQKGFANAACEAVIFGGRHYGEADGQFGIKLNAAIPFKLVDPVAREPTRTFFRHTLLCRDTRRARYRCTVPSRRSPGCRGAIVCWLRGTTTSARGMSADGT